MSANTNTPLEGVVTFSVDGQLVSHTVHSAAYWAFKVRIGPHLIFTENLINYEQLHRRIVETNFFRCPICIIDHGNWHQTDDYRQAFVNCPPPNTSFTTIPLISCSHWGDIAQQLFYYCIDRDYTLIDGYIPILLAVHTNF